MIKELSYVIAIAEKGNVSKAAESLFISQPSLTVSYTHLNTNPVQAALIS